MAKAQSYETTVHSNRVVETKPEIPQEDSSFVGQGPLAESMWLRSRPSIRSYQPHVDSAKIRIDSKFHVEQS